MPTNLQELAQDIIGRESQDALKADNLQSLIEETKNKIRARLPQPTFNKIEPLSPVLEDNIPITRVLPETPDEFGGLSPEFKDAPSKVVTDIQGLAKDIMGVPRQTTVSLFKKPEEELKFGEENIGFFPSSVQEAFEAVKPSLTVLSTPITIPTNTALFLAGNQPGKRLQSIANIILLQPEEGDEIFVGDMLKQFGINDDSIDDILTPIIGPGFAKGAQLTDKIGLIADFIGFSKFDKLLRRVFQSEKPLVTFNNEMAKRIAEAQAEGRRLNPGIVSRITRRLESEEGFARLRRGPDEEIQRGITPTSLIEETGEKAAKYTSSGAINRKTLWSDFSKNFGDEIDTDKIFDTVIKSATTDAHKRIGVLGDFLKGEKLRKLYENVLDVQVYVNNGLNADGKYIGIVTAKEIGEKPWISIRIAKAIHHGGPFEFLHPERITRSILHEAAHALRNKLDRVFNFNVQPYNSRLHEKTANKMVEHAMKVAQEKLGPAIAGSVAMAGTLALLGGGEVEAGTIQDVAKKIMGAPIRGVKRLDPLRLFPEKPLDVAASGFRVKNLVKERLFNIEEAFLDSTAFINEFKRELSVSEREALPFIRQGMTHSARTTPQSAKRTLNKIGREDLFEIIKNPSDKLLQFNEKLGRYYDDAHKMLSENFDNVGFIENYVTQIWDIPKNRRSEVINHFATHNPFTQKRTIPTLEAGIKLGLKPKNLDIVKLLQVYDQYKIKTVFNTRFAQGLKDMTDSNTGLPLMMRRDKAPADWVTIDHPALERAMMIGRIGEEGIIIRKEAVKVHPDIAAEVQAVFSIPFNSPVIAILETINAFTKKSMLSFSFFHHFALTESAFSSGIGIKAMMMWNPYKVFRALKNNNFEIFKNMPLARDSIQHGVKYGSLPDFFTTRVRQGFESVERLTKAIPIAGRTAKLARQANDLWDKTLWDYYHNTLKLYAYEKNTLASLKTARRKIKKKFNRELTETEVNEIKDVVGTFVNDSFGGQNWELMPFFRDAKNRQMTQWMLLSPDWTFSVLKQAFAPIKGHRMSVAAGSIERQLAGTLLRRRAVLFWAKAITYYNIIAQSANFYNTGKYEWIDGRQVATFRGRPRFTHQNAPGHKLNIFAGFNDDGTERYIRMGKQFREVMEWSYEPEKKLGAKLSPVLRAASTQLSKVDPGSGFPTPFTDQPIFESIPERVKFFAKSLLPFSMRGLVEERSLQPFMLALPTSRGMTNAKTIRLYKQAIEKGDPLRSIEIYMAALRNNLDADQLYTSAVASLKGEGTKDIKKHAKKVIDILNRYPAESRKAMEQKFIETGVITPEVQRQFGRMKERKDRIKAQRKAVGLE